MHHLTEQEWDFVHGVNLKGGFLAPRLWRAGARRPRPRLIAAFLSPSRFGDTLRDAWDLKIRRQG